MISLTSGPALADEIRGTPGDNSTDGAEYGKTRANYPGLGDVSPLSTLKHVLCSA